MHFAKPISRIYLFVCWLPMLFSITSAAQRIGTNGGTFTINALLPDTGSNFHSFTSAIQQLNQTGTIQDTVLFQVSSGQQFIENPPAIQNTGFSYARIFFSKDGNAANPVLIASGSSNYLYDFGFCIQGGDFIEFNGIDIEARDSLLDIGYLITNENPQNGARSNTIRNCKITMKTSNPNSIAILQSANSAYANASTTNAASGTNNNNSYIHIQIGSTNNGIILYGSSQSNPDLNNRVSTDTISQWNEIGRENFPADIGGNTSNTINALACYYQNSLTISNTRFTNISNNASCAVLYVSNSNMIQCTNIRFNTIYSSGSLSMAYFNVVQNLQYSQCFSHAIQTNGSVLYHFYASGGPNIQAYNNQSDWIQSGASLYAYYLNNVVNGILYGNQFKQATCNGTFYGCYVVSPSGFSIHDNVWKSVQVNNGALYGAYITSMNGNNNVFYNNVLQSLHIVSAVSATNAYGLTISSNTSQSTYARIYNNRISDIWNAYNPSIPSATRYTHGLHFATNINTVSNTQAVYDIFHNAVSIGNANANNASSEVLYLGANSNSPMAPVYHIRNNAFQSIASAQNGLAKHYIIWSQSTSASYPGNLSSTFNGNLYDIINPGNGFISYLSGDITTLSDWTTVCPQLDSNSRMMPARFNSNIHLIPLPNSNLIQNALFHPGYAVDCFGKNRIAGNTSIGACDSAADMLAPEISLRTIRSVNNFNSRSLNALADITDNTQLNLQAGKAPRLYYKRKTNASVFTANTNTVNGWKWNESISNHSPFDFILDYTKLYGNNQFWDTIQYFVTAQDTCLKPNTGASHTTGFLADTNGIIHTAPDTLDYFIVFPPAAPLLSVNANQPIIHKVESGSTNNPILHFQINTAQNGGPAYLQSFLFSTQGSTLDTGLLLRATLYDTGSDSSFQTNTIFGSYTFPLSTIPLDTFRIDGQLLNFPGTHHFWLTYDLKAIAKPGDSLDAELRGINYADSNYVFALAPIGNRKIKQAYCTISYPQGCSVDYIAQVRLKNLSVSSTCSPTMYTLYAGATIPELQKGFLDTLIIDYGPDATQFGRAWIDYNDDGDFSDPGEDLGAQIPANAGINGTSRIYFTVPCDAQSGLLRLRIRGGDDVQPLSNQSCGAAVSTYGECEDYTILIRDNPAQADINIALQDSLPIAIGSGLSIIEHIPISGKGCDPRVLSDWYGHFSANTQLSDIQTISLYTTKKNANFIQPELIQTISLSGNSFSFNSLADTLWSTNYDTIHFWITAAISPNAVLNHRVLCHTDSLFIQAICIKNPNTSFSHTILAPLTINQINSIQPDIGPIPRGSYTNPIIAFQLINSAGAPILLSSFQFGMGYTSMNSVVQNLKLYYTGSKNTLDTNLNLATLQGTPNAIFTLNSTLSIGPGNHWFWLCADIWDTAGLHQVVDAELFSLTAQGVNYFPNISNPPGTRSIIEAYCVASHTVAANAVDFISYVNLDSLLHADNTPTPNPGYQLYPFYHTTLIPGQTHTLSVRAGNSSSCDVSAWIDWNQNGLFETNEKIGDAYNIQGQPNTQNFSFSVPLLAGTGSTRMRIRETNTISTIIDPCITYPNGETEDYLIYIAPRPQPQVYRFKNSSGVFDAPASWIPNRITKNRQDILRFSSGNTQYVLDFLQDQVSALQIDSNTSVVWNSANPESIIEVDSVVDIPNGFLELRANSILMLGHDSIQTAGFTGNPKIKGECRIRTGSAINSYTFPLYESNAARKCTIKPSTSISTNGWISVQFFPGNPGSLGLPLMVNTTLLNHLSDIGYWKLSINGSQPQYKISLETDTIRGAFNLPATSILYRKDANTAWKDTGISSTSLYTNSGILFEKSSLRVSGQFGIAGDQNNPLPLHVIQMHAMKKNASDLQVFAQVSYDISVKQWMIIRQIHGQNPNNIAIIKNTSNAFLECTDIGILNDPEASEITYQLVAETADGSLQNVAACRYKINASAKPQAIIYPNPAEQFIHIELPESLSENTRFECINAQGKWQSEWIEQAGNTHIIIDKSMLNHPTSGLYFIRWKQNDTPFSSRIVIP